MFMDLLISNLDVCSPIFKALADLSLLLEDLMKEYSANISNISNILQLLSAFIQCYSAKKSKGSKTKFRAKLLESLISKRFLNILKFCLKQPYSSQNFNLFFHSLSALWPCTLVESNNHLLIDRDLLSVLVKLLLSLYSSNVNVMESINLIEPLSIAFGYLTRNNQVRQWLVNDSTNCFEILGNCLLYLSNLESTNNAKDPSFLTKLTSCLSKVAGILWNGSSDDQNRQYIGEMGVDFLNILIKIVEKFMKTDRHYVMVENIIGFFWNISVTPENKTLFLKTSIIQILVDLLLSPHGNSVANASGCLWVLSSDGSVREFLQKNENIKFLENVFILFHRFLNGGTVDLLSVEHLSGCLCNSALNDGIKRQLIKHETGIELLLLVLKHRFISKSIKFSLKFIDKTLAILWIVSSISDSHAHFANAFSKDKTLLTFLVKHSSQEESAGILGKSLGVIRNLSASSQVRIIIQNSSLVDVLVDLLARCNHIHPDRHADVSSNQSDSSPSVCEFVCGIITNCARDPTIRSRFLNTNVVSHLISHITTEVLPCNLAENVVSALQSLMLSENSDFTPKVDGQLVSIIFSALFTILFFNDSPRFLAENALSCILTSLKYSDKSVGLRMENVKLFVEIFLNSESSYFTSFQGLLSSQHENVVRDCCRILHILSTLTDDICIRVATRTILTEMVALSGCDSQVIRKISASCLTSMARIPQIKEQIKNLAMNVQS
ncbi:hypothetical protein GEMRC1_007645 [Eukaryota sp. GEM-RC1]